MKRKLLAFLIGVIIVGPLFTIFVYICKILGELALLYLLLFILAIFLCYAVGKLVLILWEKEYKYIWKRRQRMKKWKIKL